MPDEATPHALTHVDDEGRARMVDVSEKPDTVRTAVAEARVLVGEDAFAQIEQNDLQKGNALTIAQIAGIQGAKETSRLIPLCHGLNLDDVEVELELDAERRAVRVVALAKTTGPTGVEMEAMTAASVASLTVYDMCKSVARGAEITNVRLLSKTGGQSGDYRRASGKTADGAPTEASVQEHRDAAQDEKVGCAVVTVSDSRTAEDDRSGALMQERLAEAGHTVVRYDLVPDEPDAIGALLDEHAENDQVDAVLLNGGTGLSARDGTYEVVQHRLEKELSGFGELFRVLSHEEIGSAAMLSRAVAGTYRGRAIFSMPGSTGAVRLAMEALVLPELQHVVWELRRQQR